MTVEADDSDEDIKNRRKHKKGRESQGSDGEESGDDKPKKRRKMLFSFTEAEVRRFIKSFRKFAEPLTR